MGVSSKSASSIDEFMKSTQKQAFIECFREYMPEMTEELALHIAKALDGLKSKKISLKNELSASDVAVMVNKSPATVSLWQKHGKNLPYHIRENGEVFYKREDVEKYLAQNKRITPKL